MSGAGGVPTRWRLQAMGGLAGLVTVAGFIVGNAPSLAARYRAMLILTGVLVFGWVGVGLIGSSQPAAAQAKPAVVGKIAVTAKGDVSLDGKPVTIDVLKERLVDLKKRNGVVWYYREAGRGEPPAQAMQVIKLVIDNRLPVSMSSKPDFSDVLLPDGSTRPR